jgi:dihydropteroate synthase
VSSLLFDDRSIEVLKASDAPIVLMHYPGSPKDPHSNDVYADPLLDVYDWLEARIAAVTAAGIVPSRILVDPGVGFGKNVAANLALINGLALFHTLGCALVFGASRKRMIGALANEAPADARLPGSLALALKAADQGAQIIRVHDVAETIQVLKIWRGLRDSALTPA